MLDINILSYYSGSMKVKTSVTLSEDLLEEIDGLLDSSGNRSQFLETAAREYIAKLHRAQQNL